MKGEWISISIDEDQLYYPEPKREAAIYCTSPCVVINSFESLQPACEKYFDSKEHGGDEFSGFHWARAKEGNQKLSFPAKRSPVSPQDSSNANILLYRGQSFEKSLDKSLESSDEDDDMSIADDFEDYYSVRERYKSSFEDYVVKEEQEMILDVLIENLEINVSDHQGRDNENHHGDADNEKNSDFDFDFDFDADQDDDDFSGIFSEGHSSNEVANKSLNKASNSSSLSSLESFLNLRAYFFNKYLLLEQLRTGQNQFELFNQVAMMTISEPTDLRPRSTLEIGENNISSEEEHGRFTDCDELEEELTMSLQSPLK